MKIINMQIKTPDNSSANLEQLKYEPGIRALLKLYMDPEFYEEATKDIKTIDVSRPSAVDMTAIGRDSYSITNFVVIPGRSISFWVRSTEIHIYDEAAENLFKGTIDTYIKNLKDSIMISKRGYETLEKLKFEHVHLIINLVGTPDDSPKILENLQKFCKDNNITFGGISNRYRSNPKLFDQLQVVGFKSNNTFKGFRLYFMGKVVSVGDTTTTQS